jgi:formate/nitrite transporter FocA (FNT family)
MLLGAKVTFSDWWIWNQIPVTLGNLVGGFLFTGLFLYWTYRPAKYEKTVTVLDAVPAVSSAEVKTARA